MEEEQLLFDLFAEKEPEKPVAALPALEMRQTVLAFLASLHCDGIGAQVVTRFRKYQVAAAGFWSEDTPKGRRVGRTAVVEIYDRREHCFADCAGQEQLLASIQEMRGEKETLEAEIRKTEPELQSTDDLFSEFRTWHYKNSRNQAYQALRRRLEKVQYILYKGSRLERIRRARVADLLYLAVPEGLIAADEVADGWGLLYLLPGHKFRIEREAVPQEPAAEGRMHLVQNIAAAGKKSVLFSLGVNLRKNHTAGFSKPPRRRLSRS